MYEFRGATLQEAVHQALRNPALSTKKLAKVAAKFEFTARMRMGSVLFVGEGNLSFALTMSRKPRVPTSSILATVYEAEEDLTDSAYDNARKLLKIGCSVKTGVDATQLSDTIGKRQFRTIIFQFPNVASRDPTLRAESKSCPSDPFPQERSEPPKERLIYRFGCADFGTIRL